MTKQEVINYCECSVAIGEDDDSRYHNEVLDFIIKALKQEPCVTMRDLSEEELKHFAEEMKKVRVQVVKQEPILDKVRAEIEHVIDYTYDSTDYDKALYNRAYKDGLYEALDIIDKYNAESEDKT